MKRYLSIFLILLVCLPTFGQPKKKGKVKRKYRNVETVQENLPDIFLRGEIHNQKGEILAGAYVTVLGLKKGVNANADGEYYFYRLPEGKLSIQASMLGYKTKIIDFIVQPGQNYLNFMLDDDKARVETKYGSFQKREQQLVDISLPVNVLGNRWIEEKNLRSAGQLSGLVPGCYISEQGATHPSITFRGITSDETGILDRQRVAVYYNETPIMRNSSSVTAFFDLEQVEVAKGPQNVLFGSGAMSGAIRYVTRLPEDKFKASIEGGLGEFGWTEARGILNAPLIKKKLFARIAGVYSNGGGYVSNTLGGKLNGINSSGIRFSLRFIPSYNNKINLIAGYSYDNYPGTAFMNRFYPNTLGDTNIYRMNASLNGGENLGSGRKVFSVSLDYKHYNNENTYWTSVTSFRQARTDARWDGDGTAANALDFADADSSWQAFQEIRFNFSSNNRLNGSFGINGRYEKASRLFRLTSNEQYLANQFTDPAQLVTQDGQLVVLPVFPEVADFDSLAGLPLPANHAEENFNKIAGLSGEAFFDATLMVSRKIFITGGARFLYERLRIAGSSALAGDTSLVGNITGNYPNLLFRPYQEQEIKKNIRSLAYRAVLTYRFNEKANIYAGYSVGQRPGTYRFSSTENPDTVAAENLRNFNFGLKVDILERVYLSADLFYSTYSGFSAPAFLTDSLSTDTTMFVSHGGKAAIYGAEANLQVALAKGILFFGNYAYTRATYDKTEANGGQQVYSGNSMRLTPMHSFSIGLDASAYVTENFRLFAVPYFSYKSRFYFDDANSPGMAQDAYGLLNLSAGLEFVRSGITLMGWASNIMDENYMASAGLFGSQFGLPTVVPGAPRMAGFKMLWDFTPRKRPYYKQHRR